MYTLSINRLSILEVTAKQMLKFSLSALNMHLECIVMLNQSKFRHLLLTTVLFFLVGIVGCDEFTKHDEHDLAQTPNSISTPGSPVAPGSIFNSRINHTATFLESGKILVVGGESNDGGISSLEIYDSENGSWVNGQSLPNPRFGHTANLIGRESVLIAGGEDGENPTASTVIYNANADMWTPSLDMLQPRTKHASSILTDGRVIVVGGTNSSGTLSSSEIYDPVLQHWTSSGESLLPRIGHSVTALRNGMLLVVGGQIPIEKSNQNSFLLCENSDEAVPSVGVTSGYDCEDGAATVTEIYDPTNDSWKKSSPLLTPRWGHTATLLDDGRVLVAGGKNNYLSAIESEIFDPNTETWVSAGQMSYERTGHTASLLSDGRVLIAGGFTYVPISYAEIYDVGKGWVKTENLMGPRHMHSAVPLNDGQVLIIAGKAGLFTNLTRVELYDSDSGSWSIKGKMPVALWGHTAIPLDCENVLIVGGKRNDGSSYNLAYLFDATTGGYQTTGKMNVPRFGHSATKISDEAVVVAGGHLNPSFQSDSVEILKLDTSGSYEWVLAKPMPIPLERHSAIYIGGGRLFLTGGWNGSSAASDTWIFDFNNNLWDVGPPMKDARWGHSMVWLDDKTVLISGGVGDDGLPLSSVEKYDSVNSSIELVSSMQETRSGHRLLKDKNGDVYAIGGYGSEGTSLPSFEKYRVNSNQWNKLPDMSEARSGHSAIILKDENILITGGTKDYNTPSGTAELFDMESEQWKSAGSMREARMGHVSYQFDSKSGFNCPDFNTHGEVFIMGGYGLSVMDSVEVYRPGGGGWSAFESIVRGSTKDNLIRLVKGISQNWHR